MTAFARKAEAHLKRLRAEHDIQRVWCKHWHRAYAHVSARQVHVPKANTGIDYLINLHEMGHIASSTARRYTAFPSTDLNAEIMREASAWAWAMLHADPALLLSVTKEDWERAASCLMTYMQAVAGLEVALTLPEDGLLD